MFNNALQSVDYALTLVQCLENKIEKASFSSKAGAQVQALCSVRFCLQHYKEQIEKPIVGGCFSFETNEYQHDKMSRKAISTYAKIDKPIFERLVNVCDDSDGSIKAILQCYADVYLWDLDVEVYQGEEVVPVQ